MPYIFRNLNPQKKKANDCVIRAIAQATGDAWENVYSELCKIGLELSNMPNSVEVFGAYLERNGWQKMPMPKRSVGMTYRRYTLKAFADQNPAGTFIVNLAGHLACIADGNIYDTWNCEKKCMGNYWIKN